MEAILSMTSSRREKRGKEGREEVVSFRETCLGRRAELS